MVDLYFADEAAFSLTPSVPYGWLPIGKQVELPTQRVPVMKLFGLMDLDNRFFGYPTEGKVDAGFVAQALDSFSGHIRRPTVVVLDNASFHHRAAALKREEWEAKGLYLFFLPPYSPHLNRIEMLWKWVKYSWLEPRDYLNAQTLWDAIIKVLSRFGTEGFKIKFSANF